MRKIATRILCALTLLATAFLPTAAARGAEPATTAPPTTAPPTTAPAAPTPAAVVRLHGQIDDYARDGFVKRFNQAKATGATVVVVDLDTYGGLVSAALDISRFLKRQTDVRTVAYVADKAISAGAMIALACDEVAMAPNALLGDCAPIAIRDGQIDTLGATERAKHESPILAEFADSAARNGHDPLLASAMVAMPITVHWAQGPDGARRFVDANEFKALAEQGWTNVKEPGVPAPLDADHTLLTVSGATAARIGLAKSAPYPLGAFTADRAYAVADTFAPGAGDKAIEWLNHPLVRMLLMILFAQALYASLHVPGHGFAEALALVALALLVGVPMLTGYAQWWEIVVIFVGIALLAVELFVLPGFGVAGIAGILLLVFGLVMTFVGHEPAGGPGVLPNLAGTWDNLRTGIFAVVAALVGSILVSMVLRQFLPKLPYFNRLILTAVAGDMSAAAATAGPLTRTTDDFRPIVGALGEAISELRPGGSASFYDSSIADIRVFSVISAAGYVPRGTKVVVLENNDNRIIVRPETHV